MKNKIKKTGKLYSFDSSGYLICHQNELNIKEKYKEPLIDIVEMYKRFFVTNIHSIYVRGSVASGEAYDNISDIDLLIVFEKLWDESAREEFFGFNQALSMDINFNYPFITKVDVVPRFMYASEIIKDSDSWENDGWSDGWYDWCRFTIKHHSICIYGKDLRKSIPRYDFGYIFNSDRRFVFKSSLKQSLNKIENKTIKNWNEISENEFLRKMIWISKRVVRFGNQVIYNNLDVYTRDLYQCYKLFSKYYPNKESIMKKALEKAIYPKVNIDDLKEIVDFGHWLLNEMELKEK